MTRPFRLTAPEPLELDIHEACAQALDKLLLPPAAWFTYPAGHVQLSAAEVSRLARIGLKRSLPDIWILHQRVYCVELKRRGGDLSKTIIKYTKRGSPRVYVGQEEVFPLLIATGAIEAIAICTGVDEMLAQLAVWNIPLRKTVEPLLAARRQIGETKITEPPSLGFRAGELLKFLRGEATNFWHDQDYRPGEWVDLTLIPNIGPRTRYILVKARLIERHPVDEHLYRLTTGGICG